VSQPPQDYSERLDALWNFADPAQSEARFRAEALRYAAGSRESAEATTQIARAQGLQRKFDATDATLDGVSHSLDAQPAHIDHSTGSISGTVTGSGTLNGDGTCDVTLHFVGEDTTTMQDYEISGARTSNFCSVSFSSPDQISNVQIPGTRSEADSSDMVIT